MSCQLIPSLIKTLSWWSFWREQLSLRAPPVRSGPPTSHRRSSGDTASCLSFLTPRQESTELISQIFLKACGSPHPTVSAAARQIWTTETTTSMTMKTITRMTRWESTTWDFRWLKSTNRHPSLKCDRLEHDGSKKVQL